MGRRDTDHPHSCCCAACTGELDYEPCPRCGAPLPPKYQPCDTCDPTIKRPEWDEVEHG